MEDSLRDARKKILVGAWHRGGGQAVYAPAKKMRDEGHDVISIVTGPSTDVFTELPITTPDAYGFLTFGQIEASYVLRKERPTAVLLGTSSQDKDITITLEHALTLAARDMGIPAVAVLDFGANYTRRFSDHPEFSNMKYLPDKICVPDSLSYEAMITEGFHKDMLVITGNPYFDDIAESKARFTKEQRRTNRTGLRSNVLLWASQPIEFHYQSTMGYTEKTALLELLTTLPEDSSVIIRPHPKENPEELRAVAEQTKADYRIDPNTPLREAIMSADIVLSPFSTMLIDAAMLGVPAISFQPGLCKEDFLSTNALGITYPVLKKGEIGDVVRLLLSTTGLRQQFEERTKLIAPDGKAAERVAKTVYDLI